MKSKIKCPNCKKKEIPIEMDMDKVKDSIKGNPLKSRKKLKEAKKNPTESDMVDIFPCESCGAIPESMAEEDEKESDKE